MKGEPVIRTLALLIVTAFVAYKLGGFVAWARMGSALEAEREAEPSPCRHPVGLVDVHGRGELTCPFCSMSADDMLGPERAGQLKAAPWQ